VLLLLITYIRLGSGSDRRRKNIINTKLADPRLFDDLMADFRQRFKMLANELQADIQAIIGMHISVIVNTLNIVRDENVALESEGDQEFRQRVESGMGAIKNEIQQILSRIAT
jgi:hypothetical protein